MFVLRIEDTDASRNRPEWIEGIIDALAWIGIARGTVRGAATSSRDYADAHTAAAARAVRAPARRTTATAPARRSQRAATGAQRRGLRRVLPRPRARPGRGPGAALPGARRGRRRSWSTWSAASPTFDNEHHRGLRHRCAATARAMFLLANVVDDIDDGASPTSSAARSTCPTRPSSSCCGRRSARHAAGVGPRARAGQREAPEAVQAPRQGGAGGSTATRATSPTAMRNYLMLLGWAPRGDREIVPWAVIEDEFRLEDVNPSPAFFDVKKLRAFNGEYIRALPRRGVHRGVPAVADRPSRRTVAAPDRHYDPAVFARRGPARADPGRPCSPRSPRYVDFLFLAEPADRRGGVGQGDEGRRGRAARRRRSRRSTTVARGTADDAEGHVEDVGAGARAEAGQGPGAGAGGGHRPDGRAAAVRVAGGARPGPHPGPPPHRAVSGFGRLAPQPAGGSQPEPPCE